MTAARHGGWICLLMLGACGHLNLTDWDTVAAWWTSGQQERAMTEAHATYRAFLDDNGLEDTQITQAAAAIRERLREDVVLIPGQAGPPPARLDGARLPGPSLDRELRADLLGTRATATLRAVETVRGLGMTRHARALLAIVYRRAPYKDEGGLLGHFDVATRSVICKRAALDALQALRGTQ